MKESVREHEGLQSEELVKIFSVLTHDLRSPLFAIEGFTTLLQEELGEDSSSDALDFLSRIQHSGQQMKLTVERMNKIVKLLSKPLEIERVELRELAETVRFQLNNRAEKKGLALELADGDWSAVAGDPGMLEAALRELVVNAIDFHDAEGGSVVIAPIEEGIVVSDDGPGIPEEYREQIFDPGIQLDTNASPGVGYGLFLVRRVAELLGGTADCRSGSDGRTLFTIDLSDA